MVLPDPLQPRRHSFRPVGILRDESARFAQIISEVVKLPVGIIAALGIGVSLNSRSPAWFDVFPSPDAQRKDARLLDQMLAPGFRFSEQRGHHIETVGRVSAA